MKILLLEAFYTGSHQRWAQDLRRYSAHEIEILKLPGRHWKWRMHGGAITLAKRYLEMEWSADLIIATDMVHAGLFMSMTRHKTQNAKLLIYYHENQLTYPWSPTDPDVDMDRDNHYAFINYSDACIADRILFNSNYHKEAFLEALPQFLHQFPDYRNLETIKSIRNKASTLYIGLDLKSFDLVSAKSPSKSIPRILWNHRWEYDKNPEQFYQLLIFLKQNRIPFELIILGERTGKYPLVFDSIKTQFQSEILRMGYVDSLQEYVSWLKSADLLPVTSNQDFFGISVVEAMYCGVQPILPYRLAYPEHIPSDQPNIFYRSVTELQDLTKMTLTTPRLRKKKISAWVKKYDWSVMIQQYDRVFTNLQFTPNCSNLPDSHKQ